MPWQDKVAIKTSCSSYHLCKMSTLTQSGKDS